MGQILSHSEIEAILTGLNLMPESPMTGPGAISPESAKLRAEESSAAVQASDEATPYDFEHPEPLRPAQLDSLRLAFAAVTQRLEAGLTDLFRSGSTVNFLGIEQSTYRDYLGTAEQPACIAVFESSNATGTWLLDIDRSLAFMMIDCLLGGSPSEVAPKSALVRPFTALETRLIDKALRAVLPELTACVFHPVSLRMTRVVSDGTLIAEAKSNEAVALISYEIICGPGRGLFQLCVPWTQITQESRSNPMEADQLRELMRSGARKLPVTATVRITRLSLAARDLAGLAPGDILLTDASAEDEMSLEVGGREIFRGTPGQIQDRRVLRLTVAVNAGSSDPLPES